VNSQPKFYYPMFVDLSGKRAVLVGGGTVASRKAGTLLDAGAELTVISPKLCPSLTKEVERGTIHHISRCYREGDLEGAWLVVAATDDPEVQRQVYEESQWRRIFCFVVAQPSLCTFIVPSMVRRGPLTIAISTGGGSPALAKMLRREMEVEYPEYYGKYVELLGYIRDRIVHSESDPDRRKEKCMALTDPKVREWLKREKWDKILKWMKELSGDGELEGLLFHERKSQSGSRGQDGN